MASITISFPESGLSVAISVRNRLTGSLDFSGAMVNIPTLPDVGPTKSYRFDFTEEVDTDYTYTATATGYEIEGCIYRDSAGSSGGGLTVDEHNHLMGLSQFSGGNTVDYTMSHEEILKKFDKLLKKELKDIIDSMKIPTIDIGPIERAIQGIKPADISGFIQGISDVKDHIKNLSENVVKEYEKKKTEIEMKYRDEIEKKNSLLKENEYNLKEKQWEIEKMSGNIQDLLTEIDTITKEKEEEIQIIEDTYLNRIEEVKVETEEEIVEKIIPLLS